MLRTLFLILLAGFGCVQFETEVQASTTSAFMQRIEDLKQGRLPPPGFIYALDKHDTADFARAVCRHNLGSASAVCREAQRPTLGWALCVVAGRSADECEVPRRASVGFGLCMAAGRDLSDCGYVQEPSPGYGLCMAAGRSFHECRAMSRPNLAFAYCMGRGEDLSACIDLGRQSRDGESPQ